MAHFFDEYAARPLVRRLPRHIKANHLTILRMLLVVPVIIWRNEPIIACSALILSSVFDLFDGPVARLRGEASQFGAVLDATGDKVFILGALVFACGGRVEPWIVAAVVGIDVGLVVIRPMKRWFGLKVNSNRWGGAKMWAQSIAVGLVLSQWAWALVITPWVFYTAIALASLSFLQHFSDCFKSGPTE